jgi:tRNA (guanine10-N2)-dimethyltransferase
MRRVPGGVVARQALLSGEHPTLPLAELRALLDVHCPEARVTAQGLVATIETDPERPTGDSPQASHLGVDAALSRMALCFEWGESWGHAPDSPEGLASLAAAVATRADGKGSAAVVTGRRGTGKSANSLHAERVLGNALRDAGHTIDLRNPELVVYAWLIEGRIHVGRRLGTTPRSRFESRATDERAHFSPVSLHPRRAASLLHLARVPPGGTIYDPFCGTGGFVLEAALEGYDVWASDLDPFMVQGTLQTLTDVPPEPLDANAFVADIGTAPELVEVVDGIVTDLPYGRASGTDLEPIRQLYPRALEAIAALLRPGAYAVVGHPDPDLVPEGSAGLQVIERHAERAHKSLTRHFAVLRKPA